MKKICMILVLCLMATLAYGQNEYQYVERVDNGTVSTQVCDIAVDADGYIYVVRTSPLEFVVFNPNGQQVQTWSEASGLVPWKIIADSQNNIWTLSLYSPANWQSYGKVTKRTTYLPNDSCTELLAFNTAAAAISTDAYDSIYFAKHTVFAYPQNQFPYPRITIVIYSIPYLTFVDGFHLRDSSDNAIQAESNPRYSELVVSPGGEAIYSLMSPQRAVQFSGNGILYKSLIGYSNPIDIATNNELSSSLVAFVLVEGASMVVLFDYQGYEQARFQTQPYVPLPQTMTVDSEGYVYVAGRGHGIHKWAPTVEVEVCTATGDLPGEWCTTETLVIRKDLAPTEICALCQPVEVEVCVASDLVSCEWCVNTETRQFKSGEQPTEVCTLCEPVQAEVCTASELLPCEWCVNTEVRNFKEGEVPTEICSTCQPVEVEVCLDSGVRPSEWCVNTEPRNFKEGEEPTDVCTICQPVEVIVCSVSGAIPGDWCVNTATAQFKEGDQPIEICSTCQPSVVEVCAVTGLLPSVNCTTLEQRSFKEGQEPTVVCTTCEPSIITVMIDVKPGSYPNSINLGSHGVIPVAILSTSAFDASIVDADTVTLGGVDVAVRGKGNRLMARMEDVNGDGLLDLMIQIETENLVVDTEAGIVVLSGYTDGGIEIWGTDTIVIVPDK